LLTAESETVHALNPVASAADLANPGGEGLPKMTQRHEQPVTDGQLNVITMLLCLSRDSCGIFLVSFLGSEEMVSGVFCWVADKTDIPGA
jgi:hypothetical protein